MKIMRDHRRWMMASCLSGIGICFPAIAEAGFFDFLFQPAVPETRPFDAGPGQMPRYGGGADVRKRAAHHHRLTVRRHILANKEDHHRPHGPVDLMDDESLKHGDAVMTQAGIRIFMGPSGAHHQPEDFRKLSEIKKLPQRERRALAVLDTPIANPGGAKEGAASMTTGRSVSEVTIGETITDPNGRTVRYVGP